MTAHRSCLIWPAAPRYGVIEKMRTPCGRCGVHGVWVRVANVKRERNSIVFVFQCTMCQHQWREEHPAPQLKAVSVSKPARRRKVR